MINWASSKLKIPVLQVTLLRNKKTSHRLEENICKKHTSDERLIQNIQRTLKTHNPIKKWTKDLNRHLTKDNTDGNKHMKRCSTSYVIREMQIKTTIRYHYTPTRLAKI